MFSSLKPAFRPALAAALLCALATRATAQPQSFTGIGRTGQMFAAQTFDVTPDVLCIGKGMSGGYVPLSAMLCRRSIADEFWGPIQENPGFVEGHTFEGNPISCAAGLGWLGSCLA